MTVLEVLHICYGGLNSWIRPAGTARQEVPSF
jgi:hypothetical protein